MTSARLDDLEIEVPCEAGGVKSKTKPIKRKQTKSKGVSETKKQKSNGGLSQEEINEFVDLVDSDEDFVV